MKTILVATDFSESSLNAAKYAASLGVMLGGRKLLLYHSYEMPVIASEIPVAEPIGVASLYTESVERLMALKKVLQNFVNEEIDVEFAADEKPLITGINRLIDKHQPSLVVIGITGKTNAERILVGSNTVRLSKECPLPLLVVPAKVSFEPVRKILLTTDLKKISSTIPVGAIKAFVASLAAKLLVLNVDQKAEGEFDPDVIPEQQALRRLWENEDVEYHHVAHTDVAEGILRFAHEREVQMVISIPRSYGFFESFFHKSVSKKLAFSTSIPLLLLKEKRVEKQ